MLNIRQLVIDACVGQLQDAFLQAYGHGEPHYHQLLCRSTRQALEHIANADALYHDVEHTVMVVLAGQAILKGKLSLEGELPPRDWLHVTLALLFHDIGFVRGLCKDDRGTRVATGVGGKTLEWPDGKSAAVLTPYHVDRSKLFARERFNPGENVDIDVEIIAECIERTRFPVPQRAPYDKTHDLPGLTRAADFIGQLADPDYLRKIPALFYEFEEIGANKTFGYRNPQNMREGYGAFFSTTIMPYIQDALRYLRATQEGKQWLAYLYGNVLSAERPPGCAG